jgi:hypothetical protein
MKQNNYMHFFFDLPPIVNIALPVMIVIDALFKMIWPKKKSFCNTHPVPQSLSLAHTFYTNVNDIIFICTWCSKRGKLFLV